RRLGGRAHRPRGARHRRRRVHRRPPGRAAGPLPGGAAGAPGLNGRRGPGARVAWAVMDDRERLRIPGPVVEALACPHCGGGLAAAGGALACARGHSFDAARQGYVNLVAGRPPGAGDDREMVRARGEFFDAGHYAPLAAALAEHAARWWNGGLVVDVGAGTGHHLAAVLDAVPRAHGLAVDVS